MYRPFLADSVEAQCSQMLVRIARSLEMIAEFLMFSDVARSTPQDLRPAADLWVSFAIFFSTFLSVALHWSSSSSLSVV